MGRPPLADGGFSEMLLAGRMNRKAILAGLVLAGTLSSCGDQRVPYIIDLPSDYSGWVRIEFAVKRCPPLSREGTSLRIPIDSMGMACTSSSRRIGAGQDTLRVDGRVLPFRDKMYIPDGRFVRGYWSGSVSFEGSGAHDFVCMYVGARDGAPSDGAYCVEKPGDLPSAYVESRDSPRSAR